MKIKVKEILLFLDISPEHIICINYNRSYALEAYVDGVSIDSRDLYENNLFVPIIGDKFDGHNYWEEAQSKGSIVVLWNKNIKIPSVNGIYILVDDTTIALQKLAAEYRKSLHTKIIAITGSNGKTSTKDMLAKLLSSKYSVYKTQGNLNNEIGLPLSLLRISADNQYAVLELGMSDYGEIDLLSQICKPEIAVITNVDESHLMNFGNLYNIAKAKFEIINGMDDNGCLLLNYDDQIIRESVKSYVSKGDKLKLVSFGINNDNLDYYAENIIENYNIIDGLKISFTFKKRDGNKSVEINLKQVGYHNVYNAMVAIIVCDLIGVEIENIQKDFDQVKLTPMRLEQSRYKKAYLINDAYNASPASMRAAIDIISKIQNTNKKVLLLADMLELGYDSLDLHKGIGEYALEADFDMLIAYGDHAVEYTSAFSQANMAEKFIFFPTRDKEMLKEYISDLTNDEIILLIKGSRGMRLEDLFE